MRIIQAIAEKFTRNPFPWVLITACLILTVCGVSGSSMGVFDQMVTGQTPGLIAGQPRGVRSDEWLWQTQQTYVQKINNYPPLNQKIGLGEDVSMILDVPFRSFFALFKPQNFAFFVLPFTMAFAFKWWLMALLLCLGFYCLFDTLFPKKRLLVALGALLVLFNPFTQWWYQSITLLAVAFSLWAMFFIVKLFSDQVTTKRLALYSLGLAYAALCFVFLLYPPFQLPVVYVVAALLSGFFYHRYRVRRVSLREDSLRWIGVGCAAVLVLVIAGAFFVSHRQVLHTINGTVYPSIRDIPSGQSNNSTDGANFNMLTVLSAPTLFNLQFASKAAHFYTNQSEAARIAAVSLVMLPVVVYQALKKRRSERGVADYLLLATTVLAGIFMIRMFTPLFNLPFSLVLFNKVQNERLAIGLVLLCVVQLVLIGMLVSRKFSLKQAALTAVAAFILFFDGSIILAHQYPGFVSGLGILVACVVVSVCVFLMLRPRFFTLGLSLFVAANLASSLFVNPLYARSQPQSLQNMAQQIAANYPDNKSWVTVGSVTFEHVALMAGKQSFSGVQYYPQLDLWRSIDSSPKAQHEYNRYSHVIFTTDPLPNQGIFWSPQPDVLNVRLDCEVAAKLPHLGYVLASTAIDTQALTCLTEDARLIFPGATLYVYRYTPSL